MTADIIDLATRKPPAKKVDPGATGLAAKTLPPAPESPGTEIAISEVTWQNLVGALAAVPSMPGAKCAGRWGLFDVTDPDDERAQAAVNLCASCPALAKCREWFDGLPAARRPIGVIAGRIIKDTTDPKPAPTPDRWLTDYLVKHGPSRARDVAAAAADVGIYEHRLRDARHRLGVVIAHPTKDRPSVWRLPEDST